AGVRPARSASRNSAKVVEAARSRKAKLQTGLPRVDAMERPLNARMYYKQKGIAVGRENRQRLILLKSKGLYHVWVARSARGKEMVNEGIIQNVYENKWDTKSTWVNSPSGQNVYDK